MKNRSLWFMLGLAAGALGLLLVRRRRQDLAEAWAWQRQRRGTRSALITGASSGIGEAYARQLAALGYGVTLVARREARLQALADDLRQQYGVPVEILVADLSTPEGIARLEQRLTAGGEVDFLVNNAGYDVFGNFVDIPIEKTLGLVNCLTLAAVRFCRAALPGMIKRRHGAIVNVSSLGAFFPKPKDSTYVSAKAYLTMFSQSLASELAGTGIRVQALCPGLTSSEFHDDPQYAPYRLRERIPRWLWMTPAEVAGASLKSLAEGQVICIPGLINQLIAAAGRTGLITFLLARLRSFLPRDLAPCPPALDLLVCPHCHGPLDSQPQGLACPACQRDYPVVDGIPHFFQPAELTGLNKRFARMYDWISWFYRPFSRAAFAFIGTTEERARREVLDRLEPQGGRVLEVSVGPGVNLPYLVGRPDVGEIHGLDISLGQLQRCQAYLARKGWDVALHLGNAEQLPFGDNSFDGVFHIGGINFFGDKQKAITEMIRVAKPGTRILICDENERGARAYELTVPGFKRTAGSQREAVVAPVALVPPEMQEVRLFDVWQGWMYCLEFRKPL
jgi:short-subunit dehydrogenase/ubiquinone/menaquinone biosynthesis C-methylase UbiE/uncharacterized protein YbaR (Trm112 family)